MLDTLKKKLSIIPVKAFKALESENKELREKLNKAIVTTTIKDEQAMIERHTKELESIKSEYETKLSAMKADYESKLAALESNRLDVDALAETKAISTLAKIGIAADELPKVVHPKANNQQYTITTNH